MRDLRPCSGRGSLVLLLAFLLMQSPLLAQTDYFSLTGTFTGSSAQTVDLLLNTTTAGSTSITFQTEAFSGGTNFAGESIAGGGIDSTLTLFDGNNASVAFNDDINFSSHLWDSRINLTNPASGNYRLHMAYLTLNDGHWALDAGPSTDLGFAQIEANGINMSPNTTLNTLAFGANVAGGEAELDVGAGTMISMVGTLTVGIQANLYLSGGTLISGADVMTGSNKGWATVYQSAGLHTVTGNVSMSGTNYPPIYNLSGGTFQASGYEEDLATGNNTLASFYQSGGFHAVAHNLNIADYQTGTADYNLSGGTLSVGSQMQVGADGIGTLNQTGGVGTVSSLVIGSGPEFGFTGQGYFNQNGGSFIAGSTLVGSNYGSYSQWTIGSMAAASTGALTIINNGAVYLNGGTLSTGTILINSNNAYFSFSTGTLNFTASDLTVGPGGFFGTALNLTNTRVLSVAGTTFVQPLSTLQINATTFSTGSLVNNGGQIVFQSGTIQITNSPMEISSSGPFGGYLQLASGQTILDSYASAPSAVASGGLLELNGSTFAATAGMTNSAGAEIHLMSTSSTLAGGTISNSGLLTGTGRIFNVLSNQPGGEVRANSTDDLRFLGASNSNAGNINLINGGIVEFVSGLTNSGLITGNGNIISSGTVNNSGTITFTGGNNTFQAALVNQSPGKVIVTGNSTSTFYNPVTNNAGSEFRVSTGSEAVFLGNVIGSGSFSGQGVKIFEGGGSLAAVDTITGSSIVSATTSLTAARFREASLEVDGATHISPDGSANGTSKVNSLSIAGRTDNWTGKLDLADNDLIIDYSGTSPLADVANQIKSGRNGGAWNGNGITSSKADLTHHTLGYAENSDLGLSTFSSQSVDSTSVLVKYTWYGDSNLDGIVDVKDLYALALHYNTSGDLWTTGDFNNDGVVNVADLTLLAENWQAGFGAPLGPASLQAALANLGLPPVSVPEPTALAGLAGLCGLIARRRRRRA